MTFMLLVGTISPGNQCWVHSDGQIPKFVPAGSTVGHCLTQYAQRRGKPVPEGAPAGFITGATGVALGNLILLPTHARSYIGQKPLPLNALLEAGKIYTCKELNPIDTAAWEEFKAVLLARLQAELENNTDIELAAALLTLEHARMYSEDQPQQYQRASKVLSYYQGTLSGALDDDTHVLPPGIQEILHSELEYYIRAETAKQIEEQAFEDDDAYDSAYESISAELRTTIQDGLSTDMIKCLIAWAQCKYDMGIRGLQSPWAPQDWAQAKYERLGKKQVELQTVIPMLVEGNEFQWLSLGCNSGSNEVLLLGNGKILMRISIWHRSFYITDNSHYYLIAQPTWMKPGHPNYKLHCLLKRLFGSSPDLYDVNDIPDTEDYLSAMDLDDIALQPDIKDDVSAVNPSDVDLQLGAGDGCQREICLMRINLLRAVLYQREICLMRINLLRAVLCQREIQVIQHGSAYWAMRYTVA